MGRTGSTWIISSEIQQGTIECATGSIGGPMEASFKCSKNNYIYKGKRYDYDDEDY